MVGVLVNVGAIIIGSIIGLVLKQGISQKMKSVVMQGLGLSVIIIGVSGAIKTDNILLLVLSLVIGGSVGVLLKIEHNLDRLGKSIEDKFSKEKPNNFSKGFVTASLIYCVGAMAIIGSLEAGIDGSNDTLYVKAILDGVSAIIFTATLGYGVIFSAIPVLIYQGSIVFLGVHISDFLTDEVVNEISAVGSVLILGIGLSILEIKKINIGDLLPAILVPIVWFFISSSIWYFRNVIEKNIWLLYNELT